MNEVAEHRTRWRVEKYLADISPFRGREHLFYARHIPYEVIEGRGNVLTVGGVALLLNLLTGLGGTVYDATNAHIGVGNDGTAADSTQTDLLGGSAFRAGMDALFPQLDITTMLWQASFGPTEANFTWREWGIFNDVSAGTMLNRKAQNFGAKSGGTWMLQVGLQIV